MSIEFKSNVQALTYQKVLNYLTTCKLFKESLRVADSETRFEFVQGSARIEVRVLEWQLHPWQDREVAIVRASSQLTIATPITPELMHYLLTENQRLRFGAFLLDEDNAIVFADSVLGGENLDLMELQACILAVAMVADSYDDTIAQQFGGKRSKDIQQS